jgi:hypothetical protein
VLMIDALLLLAYCVVPAAAVTGLAYFCAKRRAVKSFLVLVAVFWAGAAWVLGHYSSVMSLTPNRISEWRHIVASLLAMAPLVVVPAAFTLAPVVNGSTARRMVVLATAGAVLGLPLAFFTGIASSCYIAHDCL